MTAAPAIDIADAGRAASATVALRWFRFTSGSTPEDDYRPFASDGVRAALFAELSRMCVAFHPHNGIRQFPAHRPVLLFFRAESTGDFVLLRIGLRPRIEETERASLEYDGLILTASDLRAFDANPWAPSDAGLFDAVRRAMDSGDSGWIEATLPTIANRTLSEPIQCLPIEHSAIRERVYSNQEVDDIEVNCSEKSARGDIPPFFATYWEHGKAIPEGYFDLVLRAPSPRGLTPAAVEQTANGLAEALRATGEKDAVRAFAALVVATLRGCTAMTPPAFADTMTSSSDEISAIADRLSAQGGDPILTDRCRSFAGELRKLRHPDPFAAARFAAARPVSAVSKAAAYATRRRRRALRRHRSLIIPVAIAVAAISLALALSVWQNHRLAIK